jgi:hypothetical protein
MMRNVLILTALLAMGVLLASCGSSDKGANEDKGATDPNTLLKKVQGSQIGGAYGSYAFFSNVKWTPVSDQQQGQLVQFDGLYDLTKIKKESCSKMVAQKGPDAVNDLDNITQMTHGAMFGLKDGSAEIRFSGWSLICSNGAQKNFPDPEMNTQKEIISNAWYTDCESFLEIARKGCAK